MTVPLKKVPTNSTTSSSGLGWTCDLGYEKIGGKCQKTVIPEYKAPTSRGGTDTSDLDQGETTGTLPPKAQASTTGDSILWFGFLSAVIGIPAWIIWNKIKKK